MEKNGNKGKKRKKWKKNNIINKFILKIYIK